MSHLAPPNGAKAITRSDVDGTVYTIARIPRGDGYGVDLISVALASLDPR